MAARRSSGVVYLTVLVIAAAAMQMQSTDAQKTYTLDWVIPTNPNTYATLAASKTFTVGDTIVFNFTTGLHTAAQVKKASYDACTTTSPISLWTTGPSSVKLKSPGRHYYICTITSHCTLGQKVAITVAAAATTPAAAPAPGSTITPSAKAPGVSSPPGAPSSASFVAAALPFTFLSVSIMALYY